MQEFSLFDSLWLFDYLTHLYEGAEQHEGAEAAQDRMVAVRPREAHEALFTAVKPAQADGLLHLHLAGGRGAVVHRQLLA